MCMGCAWRDDRLGSRYDIHTIAADLKAGVKQTGFGREMRPFAMDMYTHSKAVQVNLGQNL